jgi:predicted ATPase
MTIELTNIGIIKEATVKIDGLTVIAGENDTGKSTVGKALLFANEVNYHPAIVEININEIELFDKYSNNDDAKVWLDVNVKNLFQKIFSFSPSFDSKINSTHKVNHVVFIETPIVANLFGFFSKLDTIQTDLEYKISNYPYLFRHLFKQLKLELKNENLFKNDLINIIDSIIGGRLKINKIGELIFDKQEQQYEVNAIATGIKNFGVLQVLLNNNYLTRNALLIVDEPEVHLHPKWQLKYAQIIIELVKNGVKVLINSHSPYMIEALKRYSEVEKIEDKTNFYLAEDGYIKKLNDNNSETLVKIFEKLSEPFDVFEEMESERFQNG